MKIDEARAFWKVASNFPADKEAVYPDHVAAHGFDHIVVGERCLEYGCGGGSDARSMASRGGVVTYVDIVPENVATTRARFVGFRGPERPVVSAGGDWDCSGHYSRSLAVEPLGCVLEQSDVLPFEGSLFDRINCHGVLHHIEEETMFRVIGGFHRVLRVGGMLYAMLYTEKLFERCKKGIDALVAQGWPIDKAFSYQTDGGGIARAYSEAAGRAIFENTVGVAVPPSFSEPEHLVLDGFQVVKTVEYNNGDFRAFWVKKIR